MERCAGLGLSGFLRGRTGLVVIAWLGALGCGSRSGLDGFQLEPDEREFAIEPPTAQVMDPMPLTPPVPAPPEPSGCVDFTRSYTSVPSTVMLLIDQSGSMTAPFGGSTRWNVLRDAIVEPQSGLLSWLDQNASVGLMIYTSLDGTRLGLTCPLFTYIETAFDGVESIRATYRAAEPLDDGDTPTGDAIDAAAQRLLSLNDGTRKYILLITDGQPDTCAQPDPQNGLPNAIAAAQNAFAQGITVRTVGVSDDFFQRSLQAMANAGAGKDPWDLIYGQDEGAERPLSASTDPAELAEQLKGVIGDARTCTIELGTRIQTRRALEGRLVLDGMVLQFNAPDGWSFVDDDTLEIHGTSCERILADGEQLQVRFPCEDFEPLLR